MTMYMPVIYFPNIGHTVLGEQSCLVVFFGVRYMKNVSLMEKEFNIFYKKDKFIFKILQYFESSKLAELNDNFGLLGDVVVVPYTFLFKF